MTPESAAARADLRDAIREDCGERGQQWYDALEERKQHARLMEALPAR